MRNWRIWLGFGLLLLSATEVWAAQKVRATRLGQVTVPRIFGHHMVLQRQRSVPIWGWSKPGVTVQVSFRGKAVRGIANAQGKWKVSMPTGRAGGPFVLRIESANRRSFRDVMVGEVWLCSGQSNMEWPLRQSWGGTRAAQKSSFWRLRLFYVGKATSPQPLRDVRGRWRRSSPRSTPSFSAACYFFGRRLYRKLRIPIGLIQSAWGGTPAQAWMASAVLRRAPQWRPMLDRWKTFVEQYKPLTQGRRYRRIVAWGLRQRAKAKADGIPAPPPYWMVVGAHAHYQRPGNLYHAMVHPLVPFSIRGVAWYQGESNISAAAEYQALFSQLIQSWRQAWGAPRMPFYFVQIAPYHYKEKDPYWVALLREAQLKTYLSLQHTGIVITTDIGNHHDIHPRNKFRVGRRLARWALSRNYGQTKVRAMGPLFKRMKQRGRALILSFDHVGRGLRTKGHGDVKGFQVAGTDRIFHPAQAKIVGKQVVVSSSAVAKPVAVRFGWAASPRASLWSLDGLPASPFRTDNWQTLQPPKP